MNTDFEKRFADLESRVASLEKEKGTHAVPSESKKREKLSINEFLLEKNPGTAMDSALAIAVYHERFSGTDSFNANDILDLIRKAKKKKPKNINDLINKNIAKGYFEEDKVGEDGKKRWYVTNSGVSVIDKNFNRNEQNS